MRPEKIIIVDDDEQSLVEKVTALREGGFHQIKDFLNPEKVLDKYDSLYPFDLIITDLQMDPIDGHELIQELKAIPGFDALILLVSKGDKPEGYEGYFLHKPTLTEDYMSKLLAVVQELLSNR